MRIERTGISLHDIGVMKVGHERQKEEVGESTPRVELLEGKLEGRDV